jgi:hypothetical protein
MVVDHRTKIHLLDYALFKAANTTEVQNAWQHRLEQCKTDRELMEIAILAQLGNGREWLWSNVTNGIQSAAPLEKSRSISLLAFVDTEEAFQLLNTLLQNAPDTRIKKLLELSVQRWQVNNWAKDWFRRFLSTADDAVAWASFRLFLQCVDTRFWHWQEQVKAQTAFDKKVEQRWLFFEDNLDTIRNRIRKNEQELEKHYFGQKILQRQAWPWM